jgi:hypothetical protein
MIGLGRERSISMTTVKAPTTSSNIRRLEGGACKLGRDDRAGAARDFQRQ